jgi:hypothetical protein
VACLKQPTPHRLAALLSVVLLVLVALPEVAAGKHRRPIRRVSLAAFAVPDPPAMFRCAWNEDEPAYSIHDYECASLSGDGRMYRLTTPEDPPDPLIPPRLLQAGGNYHDFDGDGEPDSLIEGWEGAHPLAHPDIASQFACSGTDANADGALDPSEFRCEFTYAGYTHTFPVSEIVSVEYETAGGGDQFFVPCHPPPAPCVAVDLPPETEIVEGPVGAVRVRQARLTFSSSESAAVFECRLDGAAWRACTSPTSYFDLSDGSHRFEVRAWDPGGNVDPSPATREWRVDATGPRMSLSGRVVRLTRRGFARLRMRCLTGEQAGPCAGRVTLRSATRVRVSQRRRITLGSRRFRIAAGSRGVVAVKLSRRRRRLVARRGRLRVRATVNARDQLGNLTVMSRRFALLPARR